MSTDKGANLDQLRLQRRRTETTVTDLFESWARVAGDVVRAKSSSTYSSFHPESDRVVAAAWELEDSEWVGHRGSVQVAGDNDSDENGSAGV
jgi:hypothetical protein